ncbi:hypothetical protein NPIL_633821 [Nephila pilipes]|uniref:Uncharacterized protein n=1 Tax=Nephila pilipes TaxID=299642 RepID=A0A8X6NX72_NEPPI|nr:hypothetical protein NPIL_633821 [Nephila pilipes]
MTQNALQPPVMASPATSSLTERRFVKANISSRQRQQQRLQWQRDVSTLAASPGKLISRSIYGYYCYIRGEQSDSQTIDDDITRFHRKPEVCPVRPSTTICTVCTPNACSSERRRICGIRAPEFDKDDN